MTDFDLPSPGLGTSANDDFEECAETVRAALELGYRHVDTAQMYDNETAVGEGIRRADVPREDVVVATKVHPDNLAYDDATRTARESLDRLGLDAVDLLYVHWPTSAYDPEETLRAIGDLREEGLCDHVGLSNFPPELLDEARAVLDSPVAAHQVECHPLFPQEELRRYAVEHGHSLVGYSPLGRGEALDDPLLTEIAEKHDASTAAVCLAWAFAQKALVPIPKATGDHVRANYEARELELDEEDLARIAAYDVRERVIDPDGAAWNR
ncbi:aldo/keto reductase [Halobaculum gomorrense]|uniref:2,5-diketo-D-gluconate reductase B n=1 Tax=Halobaculum gomorrense TaxID=43928 RepID=A0A1M5N037_9EURY|nr:aldo/keto reductase [Halobaculum gomorrense]SHG82930.1 2,5-diketo-D-gluconate reductase B [Halobaculum gomorrense]